MTLAEVELKCRCDELAKKILNVLENEARDLPGSLCVVIAIGAAAALAIANGVPRSEAMLMLNTCWQELTEIATAAALSP